MELISRIRLRAALAIAWMCERVQARGALAEIGAHAEENEQRAQEGQSDRAPLAVQFPSNSTLMEDKCDIQSSGCRFIDHCLQFSCRLLSVLPSENGGCTIVIKVQDTVAYDLAELSAQLGVSTRTLRNYIRQGRLQAFKLGLKYYVTQRALDAYFDTPSTQWE